MSINDAATTTPAEELASRPQAARQPAANDSQYVRPNSKGNTAHLSRQSASFRRPDAPRSQDRAPKESDAAGPSADHRLENTINEELDLAGIQRGTDVAATVADEVKARTGNNKDVRNEVRGNFDDIATQGFMHRGAFGQDSMAVAQNKIRAYRGLGPELEQQGNAAERTAASANGPNRYLRRRRRDPELKTGTAPAGITDASNYRRATGSQNTKADAEAKQQPAIPQVKHEALTA